MVEHDRRNTPGDMGPCSSAKPHDQNKSKPLFYGIGVGPGDPGLIPLAAVEAIRASDLIFLPKSKVSETSVALRCLVDLDVCPKKFREIEFNMETDRTAIRGTYGTLADSILSEIRSGNTVAYLTLGDPMTYSTFAYLLKEISAREPALPRKVIPGITSFHAAASALEWSLCEGKERVLICPCPDNADELRREIFAHDAVVLMKVNRRLGMVLALLEEMGITEHCAMASYIGHPDEKLFRDLALIDPSIQQGYLSTVLIRKQRR